MAIAGQPSDLPVKSDQQHRLSGLFSKLITSSLLLGLSLRTKLIILMSMALVVFPWFSYQYLSRMEDFLVESQANAQLLTAEGISNLLNGRTDLFDDLPLSPEGYEQLFAHPLEKPVQIDGKDNDWEDILEYQVEFGGFNPQENNPDVSNQFYLVLGEYNDQIFTMLHVNDDKLVFRNRNILRLDMSDHIRIEFTGQEGTTKRYIITMTDPGVTTTYPMSDWRYAIGEAENRIQGFMTQTPAGYLVEFRIPRVLLGTTPTFGLNVVDVDDIQTRSIESVTGTLPSDGREAFGLVVLKSPEVLKIVEGLGYSAANIQVIDRQGRIRADVGGNDDFRLRSKTVEPEGGVFKEALAGRPAYQRLYSEEESEVIIAAHPIVAEDEIIGAVILRQNTDEILELRRDSLNSIVNLFVLSIFIFIALILVFSVHLTGRISKLGTEATSSIDIYGRLKKDRLTSETSSGDEIGDLARSFSGMLNRLHQHTRFLENMPRTLRHEINNPLNTLSTSLQNLEAETSEPARTRYLDSAQRAVMRINEIVQNLADAASLEDALEADELDVIDLHSLIENYIANCHISHPDRQFEYWGTRNQALCRVSDLRIEQLLDKLIDNAVDFSEAGSTINIDLNTDKDNLRLSITNQGPSVPEDRLVSIFDSMVSIRSKEARLHIGMGLYVVRVIAEHHGGSVSAANLPDGNGVTVSVNLPMYNPVKHVIAASG